MTAATPKISRQEWKQVAATLLGIEVPSSRARLSGLGLNERQIAALGLLSL